MHLLHRMASTWLVLILSLTSARAQSSYQLIGTAPDSLNGQMVYIGTIDYSGQKHDFKDSVLIENGHFQFTGQLPQTAMLTTIFMRSPRMSMNQFYLENRPIKLTIHPTSAHNLLEKLTYENAPVTEKHFELKKIKQENMNKYGQQMRLMDSTWSSASKEVRQQMEDQLKHYERISRNQTIAFIKANPDSYYSLHELCYMIAGYKLSVQDADSLQGILSGLSSSLQQMPEAQRLRSRIGQAKATSQGQIAPWANIPTDQNVPLSLTPWKGKYIILDFWASWCGPCLQNLPALKELYSKFHANGVEVVGISLDSDKERWTKAIKQHELSWPQVSDLKGWKNEVAVLYDIRAIPQYVLIGPDGKIMTSSTDLEKIRHELEHLPVKTSTTSNP